MPQILTTDVIRFTGGAGRWFVFLVVFAVPALALNPVSQVSQYAHTSWRSDAGITAVRRIKQTPDGYLWLATRAGLVRFDGVRFTTFKAGLERGLESSTTQDLVIDPDGSIWVATLGGGIAHNAAGKFRTYTVKDGLPSDEISSLYRDSRGTLWVGTRGAGIARMVNGRFEKLAVAIPPSPISAFLEGADQSLWIAAFGYGVFRLQNGILTSFTVNNGLPDNRVTCLYLDHSGRIWTAGYKGISSWNGIRFVPHPAVNAAVSYAISCTQDRAGNLWIASSSGLFRAQGDEVSHMDRDTGLSADFASDIFEDREGNLWVGTRGGLDQFRDSQVRIFTQRQGFIVNPGPIIAGSRGVWTTSNRQIGNITANAIGTWPLPSPSGSTTYTMSAEAEGGLWIGSDKGVTHWKGKQASLGLAVSGLDVRSLLQAHDGTVWIGAANRGLLCWKPSAAPPVLIETGVSDRFISTLAEDHSGTIWAGSNNGGGLYRLSGGIVRHFGRDEGLRSPDIYTVFIDRAGDLWIGSTGGLSWFENGRIRTVNSAQGLPADQVFAICDDFYDRLWLTGFAGIAAIGKKSLADLAAGRRNRVNPILYRIADGVQVNANIRFPIAARTPDGHVWFSLADGLAEVTPPDPAASHSTQFPVLVEEVTVDGAPQTEIGRVRMSPGTRSVEFRYTALTLSNAEAVRFRYRLEGIDKDWVYADTRRLAFYDNLKPGDYTFHVGASVDGAQWQESSALVLEQLPFLYQTWWFMLLASASAFSLAFSVYRLRVRQITREFNVRLEERVNERTRLARDLHDTLLQSFHGLMLRFQAVSKMLPEGTAKENLEKTLERADQAVAEGRSTIYDLRSSVTTSNELSEAVNAVGNELSTEGAAEFGVVVEGPTRELHPIIRDEIYRIAREVLRNAFKHAHARHVEAEISYGPRVFRLIIRDDGEGIPTEILEQGRPGHYGLRGIRERARQVGAELTIWSRAGAGTEISLSLAGSIAYGQPPRRSRLRIFGKKAGAS